MCVDMPDGAVAGVQGVERLEQRVVIGAPAALDARAQSGHRQRAGQQRVAVVGAVAEQADAEGGLRARTQRFGPGSVEQIGRASCRGRVGQYVELSVVAVSLKKKKN